MAHADVDSELDEAVQQGRWRTVGDILYRRVGNYSREQAIRNSIERADQQDIIKHIIQHCTGNMHELALKIAVGKSKWEIVGALLNRGGSGDQFDWVVEDACARASQAELIKHIFPGYFHFHQFKFDTNNICRLCPESQTDLLVIESWKHRRLKHSSIASIVKRGMWRAVRYLLDHKPLNLKDKYEIPCQWILTEAVHHASDELLADMLIKLVPGDYNFILKVAVRRGLWHVVIYWSENYRSLEKELQTEENRACCTWAVKQAFKHGSDDIVARIIVYASNNGLQYEYSCFEDVESVFSELLRRRLWGSVCTLLERVKGHLSHEKRNQIVREALGHADAHFLRRLLPMCADDQRELALNESVRRGLWDMVAQFLTNNRIVSDNCYRHAVEEGLKRADNLSLIEYILPHCADDQTDLVLEQTVERGIWGTVSQLLKKRVSVAQRRLAIEKAVRLADDTILNDILPRCADDQLNFALKEAVRRDLWDAVVMLLKRGVTDIQQKWILQQATERADDYDVSRILPICAQDHLGSVLTVCVDRGLWHGISVLLKRRVADNRLRDVVKEASIRADGSGLQLISHFIPEDQLVSVFTELIRRKLTHKFNILGYIERQYHDQPHGSVAFLVRCTAYWLVAFITSYRDVDPTVVLRTTDYSPESTIPCSNIINYLLMHFTLAAKTGIGYKLVHSELMVDLFRQMYDVCCEHNVRYGCRQDVVQELFISFTKTLYPGYYNSILFLRNNQTLAQKTLVLPLFALQITNPVLQSIVLRDIGKDIFVTWDLVQHVDTSRVWEEVRRWLLQAAVTEKQWKVVTHLADHSLYDDQRNWLMKVALEEKQWDVLSVLADHGLTDDQLRRVHRQVAKHANWDTVQQLFTRGANLRQVREDLETANPSRLRPPDKRKLEEDEYKKWLAEYNKIENDYKHRVQQLKDLESQLWNEAKKYKHAVHEGRWNVVLYKIFRGAGKEIIDMALEAAVETKAAHVLVTLVRRGLDDAQRISLFSKVVTHGLWAAGRALLERPVSRELFADFGCWETLHVLMEAGQWVLVARVMEYGVGDELRRRVMWEALDRREGSVVAHIISCMEGEFTVVERETVFKRAITHGLWQTVWRLVEEKDCTGIDQRDKAMFAAMQQNRWDVVQHCITHGADIDKLDATGLTKLQQAIRDNNCKVKELLHHGADQFVVDSDGNTGLHVALKRRSGGRGVTKMLVEFHGDINQPDPEGHNALHHLVKNKDPCPPSSGEILECALLWGRNVGQRVDFEGETAVHVLCQERRYDAIRYFVARGADTLAVTDRGETVLLSAVVDPFRLLSYDTSDAFLCQALVAECIKLGISTHQPRVTDFWFRRNFFSPRTYSSNVDLGIFERCSPFQQALIRQSQYVMKMLYESGTCSNYELSRFYSRAFFSLSHILENIENIVKKAPRSLQSLCRLVISHHVGVAKPRVRERRVKQLRILSDIMKDYVLFLDILDPEWFANKYFRTKESRETNLWEAVKDHLETAREAADRQMIFTPDEIINYRNCLPRNRLQLYSSQL